MALHVALWTRRFRIDTGRSPRAGVAIWDQAGLQNRPVRFDSSAARNKRGERASWWGTGPENQRDRRVRGSIPPLSASSEWATQIARCSCAQGVPGCTLARQVRGAGSSPAERSRWLCREGWAPTGLISRTSSVRFRPLQRGRPRPASPTPKGGVPPPIWLGEKSALADRASHVCKSAVIWWDDRRALPLRRRRRRTRPVPGRGPFESVERLSDTRVAKRQRRRLLSALPQVRILPLVLMSPSASWPRPPPSQGGDQGSNPCGDAAYALAVRLDGRRATNAEVGGSNPLGGTRRERSSHRATLLP